MANYLLPKAVTRNVCSSCQRRPLSTAISTRRRQTRPSRRSSRSRAILSTRYYSSEAPKLNYVALNGRTLISLDGPDATDFLHNLVPAPVVPLSEQGSCIASAFLNAKGRILHDVFIYKPTKENGDKWFLEVDTNSASAVTKHLKKHKLRSKFKLQQLSEDEARVFYLWPRSAIPGGIQNLTLHQDPRPKMGKRGYVLGPDAPKKFDEMVASQTATEEYHWEDYLIHRILNGHAEGPIEILSEHALPQESNFDFYGGIDFHKGCYLGQELTIRTHHTGIVRKRILPVQLYPEDNPIPLDQTRPRYDPLASLPQPPHEANIAKYGAKGRSGRSTAKWLTGYGNIGLALCRLETMTDLSLTAEGSKFDPDNDAFEVSWEDGTSGETQSVKAKAFVPSWLRQAIDDSIKARSERSQARRQKDVDEDDEDVD